MCGRPPLAFIGKYGQKLRGLRATHVTGGLHQPVTLMARRKKSYPVLGFEAIVFVTKCFLHLIKQALGLGKIGDRVHSFKTMYKNAVPTLESKLPNGVEAVGKTSYNLRLHLI
jgi:hypothetical protein